MQAAVGKDAINQEALWQSGRLCCFVEPQGTVAHEGVAPKLQVFMGLNMQFPLKR